MFTIEQDKDGNIIRIVEETTRVRDELNSTLEDFMKKSEEILQGIDTEKLGLTQGE